jgi:hypothetical protein
MPILKLEKDDENKQLEFELAYQRTLTTQERFELMLRKSREIAEVLLKYGYRKPVEIILETDIHPFVTGVTFDEVWRNHVEDRIGQTPANFASLDDLM